jgi:hypothetical protein
MKKKLLNIPFWQFCLIVVIIIIFGYFSLFGRTVSDVQKKNQRRKNCVPCQI